MDIKWKKRLTWALLYFFGGGGLFFFVVVASYGPPPSAGWWLWPIAGLLGSMYAITQLIQYHRLEPEVHARKPQLSITDLWMMLATAGFLMACWNVVSPQTFEPRGLIVGVLFPLAVLGGVMKAVRMGCVGFMERWFYGFGFALTVLGGMGTGSLVMTVICVSIGESRSPLRILGDILSDRDSLMSYLRWSILILPAGIGMCALARKVQLESDAGLQQK